MKMFARSSRTGLILGVLVLLPLGSCAIKPITQFAATSEGIASYYSNDFQGRKTSSGEIFDNSMLTAAHRTFPFGTRLRVTNLDNEKFVEVRVNDRGPVKPERIIDLTYAAARRIGIDRTGLGRVKLDVLEWGKTASQGKKKSMVGLAAVKKPLGVD